MKQQSVEDPSSLDRLPGHSIGTPIVDTVLGDPLRVPGDVGTWLQACEERARKLLSATGEAVAAGDPTRAMAQAHARLNDVIGDERNSILRRALNRPLIQLAQATPARNSLERLVGDVFRRADAALELHPSVMALLSDLAELRARFEESLPSLTGEHLRQAGIDSGAFERIRSSADIHALRTKLSRVEQVLGDYASELSPTRAAELALEQVVGHADITIGELEAALGLRLRVRQKARETNGCEAGVHAIMLHHLNELEAQVTRHVVQPQRQDASAAVVEQLLERVFVQGGQRGAEVAGSAMFGGVLAGLHNALYPREGYFSWRPPAGLLRRVEHSTDAQASEQSSEGVAVHAIPIGGDYVCLTTTHPSVVRVYSRAIRVDRTVECQVVVDGQTITDTEVADIDLTPLFEGVDESRSSWYRTTRRAKVKIIAAHEGRWFGRLERAGVVAKLDDASWRQSVPVSGAFRILRSPSLDLLGTAYAGGRETPEVAPVGQPVRLLGVETVQVRTGFAGAEAAWLRYPSESTRRATNAIRREYRLLRALTEQVRVSSSAHGVQVVEPIAAARIRRQRRGWPVLAIPLGLRPDDAPTFSEWIRSGAAAARNVVTGVARIMVTAHAAGYALGACDLRMFAFSAAWESLDTAPVPEAILVTAPACAPFGEKFHAPVAVEGAERYSHLGLSLLVPPVRDAEEVTKQADAFAFAAFLVDLLAREPLASPPRSWEEAWSRAAECADDEFLAAPLVRKLGSMMQKPNGSEQLLSLIHDLGSRTSRPRTDIGGGL